VVRSQPATAVQSAQSAIGGFVGSQSIADFKTEGNFKIKEQSGFVFAGEERRLLVIEE
jgi:hypothetical protein